MNEQPFLKLDLPKAEIGEEVPKITPVNANWATRPKSNIIKYLMKKSEKTAEDISRCLGCSEAYLNNKLHRDSFSLDDIICVAYACGYILTFIPQDAPDVEEPDWFQINVQDYLYDGNKKALLHLWNYSYGERIRKKKEYDQLKEKLEQMKTEYGFED